MVFSGTPAVALAALLFLYTHLLPIASARPHEYISRDRRSGISDQRLAELETLMALSRLKGHMKTITRPIAFGIIDANKIGRRKRSSIGKRHDADKDVIFVLRNDDNEGGVQFEEERSLDTDDDSFYQENDPKNQERPTSSLTVKMSSIPSVSMLRMAGFPNEDNDEGKLYLT